MTRGEEYTSREETIMSIDVPLTPQEVVALKRITNVHDDAQAITQAVREFLRLAHLRELKAASGTVEFESNWQQLEALELDEFELPR
jgi:hypothetical protein